MPQVEFTVELSMCGGLIVWSERRHADAKMLHDVLTDLDFDWPRILLYWDDQFGQDPFQLSFDGGKHALKKSDFSTDAAWSDFCEMSELYKDDEDIDFQSAQFNDAGKCLSIVANYQDDEAQEEAFAKLIRFLDEQMLRETLEGTGNTSGQDDGIL
jgi:hypothetical protein